MQTLDFSFNHQLFVIWVRNTWAEQGVQQCHRWMWVQLWLCFSIWSM